MTPKAAEYRRGGGVGQFSRLANGLGRRKSVMIDVDAFQRTPALRSKRLQHTDDLSAKRSRLRRLERLVYKRLCAARAPRHSPNLHGWPHCTLQKRLKMKKCHSKRFFFYANTQAINSPENSKHRVVNAIFGRRFADRRNLAACGLNKRRLRRGGRRSFWRRLRARDCRRRCCGCDVRRRNMTLRGAKL